jgi:hypothetical protein
VLDPDSDIVLYRRSTKPPRPLTLGGYRNGDAAKIVTRQLRIEEVGVMFVFKRKVAHRAPFDAEGNDRNGSIVLKKAPLAEREKS